MNGESAFRPMTSLREPRRAGSCCRPRRIAVATCRGTEVGSGVNIAARIQGAAAPAQVLVSDTVFNTIKSFRQGAGFSDIQTKTGFDEKKLRNIIFRLNKLNKIKRKSRGIYIVA